MPHEKVEAKPEGAGASASAKPKTEPVQDGKQSMEERIQANREEALRKKRQKEEEEAEAARAAKKVKIPP